MCCSLDFQGFDLTFLQGWRYSRWSWSSSPSRLQTSTWEQTSFCWPKTWRLCCLRGLNPPEKTDNLFIHCTSLKSNCWCVRSRMFAATYVSRAEAAVRSWRADDPVDVRRVEALHIHVYQMLLEGWKRTNLSEFSLLTTAFCKQI